jgi:hypothetical protein
MDNKKMISTRGVGKKECRFRGCRLILMEIFKINEEFYNLIQKTHSQLVKKSANLEPVLNEVKN